MRSSKDAGVTCLATMALVIAPTLRCSQTLSACELFPMTFSDSHSAVRDITDQILATRRITRGDQQRLMVTLLSKNALSSEDRAIIDRIFDQLHRGLLHVVD